MSIYLERLSHLHYHNRSLFDFLHSLPPCLGFYTNWARSLFRMTVKSRPILGEDHCLCYSNNSHKLLDFLFWNLGRKLLDFHLRIISILLLVPVVYFHFAFDVCWGVVNYCQNTENLYFLFYFCVEWVSFFLFCIQYKRQNVVGKYYQNFVLVMFSFLEPCFSVKHCEC